MLLRQNSSRIKLGNVEMCNILKSCRRALILVISLWVCKLYNFRSTIPLFSAVLHEATSDQKMNKNNSFVFSLNYLE